MSFTGHLEDLAIVDVIQLLHSARKSGTLCVQCGNRESQLVFSEGYVISANHADSSVRIGKILVDMGSLSQQALDEVLQQQQAAGEQRKPLIGMLIESGQISREKAFKGLESLIEMTIVEMVSWTRGIFTLDVDQIVVSDEYRYFPETLKLELSLDTQMLLMDALRIFDEKKRDGEIVEQEPDEEPVVEPLAAQAQSGPESAPAETGPAETMPEVSADDLGLDGIEDLEAQIPDVFIALKAFDPAEIHRQELAQSGAALEAEQSEELVDYLASFASRGQEARRTASQALLLVSRDQSLRHQLMTVCKADGVMVFVVASGDELFSRAEAALARGLHPLVMFDAPAAADDSHTAAALSELRQTCRQRFARLPLIQLAAAKDAQLVWQAYRDGAQAVIVRPSAGDQPQAYAAAAISFLEAVRAAVRSAMQQEVQPLLGRIETQLAELANLREVPAVAYALLQAVAEQFPRALTLVVRKGELIAERGIGLSGGDREAKPGPVLRIPLDSSSLLQRAVESGEMFFGPADEALLGDRLFAAIGAPQRPDVLLLPLICRGRTLCLTYADFGAGETAAVLPESLKILARHAGLVLDNALYRKQAGKPA